MKSKNNNNSILQYKLEQYASIHRSGLDNSNFGYNNLSDALKIEGFQLFSTKGLKERIGPLKSFFYRVGFTLSGSVSVELGLEKYKHSKGTVNFTSINDIFSLYNTSEDFFGYYMLFTPSFMLEDEMFSKKLGDEYPFFNASNLHFLHLSEEELTRVTELTYNINEELQQNRTGKVVAIRMYLSLILLECKRSYERQGIVLLKGYTDTNILVTKFRKLIAQHFLTKKQVSDYASILAVTPNHLNKIIKENTGLTALESIQEMLLLEAKTQLKHTDKSISEIAYELDFSDPASFNRFFKRTAGATPLEFRLQA